MTSPNEAEQLKQLAIEMRQRGNRLCNADILPQDWIDRAADELDALALRSATQRSEPDAAALRYLLDSTAPDGQWADQAVHNFVGAMLKQSPPPATARSDLSPFQGRVAPFMEHCFGPEISADTVERYHRFIEESLELAQALGCSAQDAHMLVDYVFSRPVGQPHQEVGGVMVTLAALCLAADLDMHIAGENELWRVWGKIDVIREKQRNKPKGSPIPQAPQSERLTIPKQADILLACGEMTASELRAAKAALTWFIARSSGNEEPK
jgi:hypothetical protein